MVGRLSQIPERLGMDGVVGNGWGWMGWMKWLDSVTPVNGELDVNRLGTSPMEVVGVVRWG